MRVLGRLDAASLDGSQLGDAPSLTGPALVLERLAGPTLADAGLKGDEALQAWAQVAHALEALHAHGFVHRDVRPENVILRAAVGAGPLEAVLADLGTAALSGRETAAAGTPDYLAPETLAGVPPRPAADVHGLGGLLFFLVTGKAPWSELDLAESLDARRLGPPAWPAGAMVPPKLKRVLERLLSPSPWARPPGALAAVRLLNAETGRTLPAEPGALSARPGLARFVGRATELAAIDELLASTEARRVLLRGPEGSGRSRLLDEIEVRARLAGRPVHRQVPAEVPGDAVLLVDDETSAEGLHLAAGLLVASAEDGPAEDGDLRLGPLSEDECLELAAALLGLPEIEDGDGAVLLAASGGLPGPLEQLIASLAESGGLRFEDGRLAIDAERAGERPDVVALLSERSARLSADAAVRLDLAALFRQPISATLLSALAGCSPGDEEHEAALAELRHGGLLRATAEFDGVPHYQVPSPARGAVLARLPASRRRLLHLGATAALKRLVPDSEGEQAWHLEQAGAGERAAPLHRSAGLTRLIEGLPREAAAHLERALALGESGPDLLLGLARAEALLGDAASAVGRIEQALPQLSNDEERAKALAFAAETASHAGDAAVAEAACRRARRLFRGVGSLVGRAECTSRLALLALGRGDWRRARAGFRAALDVARKEGDSDLEARALNNLGTLARRRGDLDAAARHHDEAHRLRKRNGDLQGAAKALNNLGIVRGMAGRSDEAAEAFAQAVAAFREVGDRREEARALNNRGMTLWLDGRLHEAAETFSQTAGLFESLDDSALRAEALRNEGLVDLDRGEFGSALERLEEATACVADADSADRADILLDLGDARRALGALEQARSAHEQSASLTEGAPSALASLAAALDAALAEGGRAQPATEPGDLADWRPDLQLRWHLEAGRLSEAVGDDDSARAHGEAAFALAHHGAGAHEQLWAAVLAAGSQPEGAALDSLQDALSGVPAGQVPSVAWRAHLRLARGFARDGRRLMAGAQAEAARELLATIARRLDDEQRAAFEAVPERAAARKELETLAAVGGGAPASQAAVAPVLLEFVRLLNEQLDVEALLPRVVDFAIELTGADRGCLILFDSEPEGVRVARGRGGEDLPRERFQHSQTIVRQVRKTGEPLVVDNFAGDEEAMRSQSVHELQLGSATCVPLPEPAGVAGGALGAIYVDSPTRRTGFAQREVDTLAAVAAHAATAIVNAQLIERTRAESQSLASEVERLRESGAGGEEGFGEVLGRSPAMSEVFSLLERVAPSNAGVLIEGESGTGKELAARSIHQRSRRADGPFVAVDLGTLPESLVESELFGHRKGAFTGADRDRAGLFEQAGGGTIFLDEITNTNPSLQASLLRVLQEREVRRVGDDSSRGVDVRVVSASNKFLANEVAAGRFREDLFYRLNVVSVRLPPLRERPEDVPLLARHFLERALERENKAIEGFQPAALTLLARFDWPGNVRQLQNVVERAVVMAEGGEIAVADLPPAIVGRSPARSSAGEIQADSPAAETPRVDLWTTVVDKGEDFWTGVRDPFANHDLTRSDVIALVSRGLMKTGGKYKDVARLLGIPDAEYKRFMDFLRQNRCRVDFRPFREAAKKAQAGEKG
jgi:transcriptional regulator with GAF, ATPase, and Fis domain/Tfp pilus assembly protein PilF